MDAQQAAGRETSPDSHSYERVQKSGRHRIVERHGRPEKWSTGVLFGHFTRLVSENAVLWLQLIALAVIASVLPVLLVPVLLVIGLVTAGAVHDQLSDDCTYGLREIWKRWSWRGAGLVGCVAVATCFLPFVVGVGVLLPLGSIVSALPYEHDATAVDTYFTSHPGLAPLIVGGIGGLLSCYCVAVWFQAVVGSVASRLDPFTALVSAFPIVASRLRQNVATVLVLAAVAVALASLEGYLGPAPVLTVLQGGCGQLMAAAYAAIVAGFTILATVVFTIRHVVDRDVV